jgi:hypothetical protein
MKHYFAVLFPIALMLLLMPACIDPTEIGSELLDEDLIDVGFTDTITVRTTTIKGDSVLTYQYLSFQDGYLFGDYNDPFFGRSRASFFGQVGMRRTASGLTVLRPDFEDMILDSTILVMALDSNYFYGDIYDGEPFVVKVSELAEYRNPVVELYSNQEFIINPDGIGGPGETILEIIPRVDSITVFDYSGTGIDTITFPHFRLTLPNSFGQRLMDADSTNYDSDSTFVEFFPGFAIEPVSENDGLLSLDMIVSGSDAVAGLYLYFSPVTGEDGPGQYRFPFNAYRMRTSTLENDHFAAPVEQFIDKTDVDTIAFMQGMEGLYTKLDLPYIDKSKGLIVNKAELVLTLAELPGIDYDANAPVERFIISKLNEDGDQEVVADIALASDLNAEFGGTIIEGVDGKPDQYVLNISNHMQDVIDGLEPSTLYMTTYRRAFTHGQTAIYGGAHEQYPAKINLYFTKQ